MAERSRDWLRQAEVDLRQARSSRESGFHEWAAFAAHQAAEKAIKAVFQKLHLEAWGHALSALLEALPPQAKPDAGLIERAKDLDLHYIPTRCPNGFERGAPTDYYTRSQADRAIADAEAIIGFCRDQVG